ncbi:thioredoxin-like protein [Zychaea mexicana]|uniref:thioredoxin-like protein n=1 Tax=Zychaea mexicana TaxID=64656 RepID=UPI0022FE2B0C|nr:thioredoxin-like protein [Zychaea mexicana]KAI9496061.1 thioredoxin-like protein [Zychaea mexicana]
MFHAGLPRFTGKTVEASSTSFAELVNKADHPVIVDFYANWCGPCKMLGPLLEKSVAANPKVTLVKLDVDEAVELAAKYQIAALPTVAAFNKGEVVDQFVGMRNGPQVETFVKKHAELA